MYYETLDRAIAAAKEIASSRWNENRTAAVFKEEEGLYNVKGNISTELYEELLNNGGAVFVHRAEYNRW